MRYVWAFSLAFVSLAILMGAISLLDRFNTMMDGMVAPAVLVLIVAAHWLMESREKRLKRWQQTGCCRVCGYELRATPERCPECGLQIESKRV